MTDNLSVFSGRSLASMSQLPKKVYVDGQEYGGEYLTKDISLSSTIFIEIPETIKNKVQGDKTAVIRMLQIYDKSITDPNKAKTLFVAKAFKQRNNYNSKGLQTEIIGYGIYDASIDRFVLDSQFFELDSDYAIRIQLYTRDRTSNIDTIYTLPNDNESFIYYDIQTNYSFGV